MKEKSIGILRALDASNKYLRKLFLKETLKYASLGIILGIVGGFVIVRLITELQMLRAFGHVLSTPLSIDDILFISTLSFSLAIISAILISGKFMKRGISDIIIKKETEKEEIMLEEVIGK
jgi:ABC-type antimicrobial peptide transport system permease subunit